MGNQAGAEKAALKINNEINNSFRQILKCPSQSDLNNRLNTLLNQQFSHIEWIGSILADDIRQYYHEHNENIENILTFIIDFLYDTTKEKKDMSKEYTNVVNNCLRLICIILPIVYENSDKMAKYMWDCKGVDYKMQKVQKKNKLVVYISNDENIDKKREDHISSGIKLISSLQTLCFFPGYTILPSAQIANIQKVSGLGNYVDNQQLWANILMKNHPNSTNKYDENRLIVLSSILACISSTLYAPFYGQNYLNPWLAYLTSPINPNSGLFFMNFFFQILSYKPSVLDSQSQKILKAITLISSQIVYSILCHQPKSETLNGILEVNVGLQQVNDYFQDSVEENKKGQLEVFTVLQNGILDYLNQFNEELGVKKEYIVQIVETMLCLLEEPLKSENSLFVNSFKEIQFNEENFGILQQLLYYCPQIADCICTSNVNMYRLFKITIFQFCKSIDEKSVNNTYYVSLCLLTILSNNKSFNEMLNMKKDFNINLKTFPIIDGTLADLLISCCAQAIINNKFQPNLCHPFNIMSILKNISPYVKNISRISCQKLNQLAILFTDMDFLTQTQFNPLCIVKLVEMYNYIISYNFNVNLAMVFEIYNRQEIFTRIPKINFHEKTLRAYYKQLKERYEQNKNNNNTTANTISQVQNQQQVQLQKQGQQLQELSSQIKQQRKESIAQNQKPNEQEDMPSSSSLSSRKRPKRVIKKKVGLDHPEGDSKNLQEKQSPSPKNSKKNSKINLDDPEEKNKKNSKKNLDEVSTKKKKLSKIDLDDDEEVIEEESKSQTTQKKSSSKSEIQQQKLEKKQSQQNQPIEIVVEQKSAEDLFVEKWKHFNWRQTYSSVPIGNIYIIFNNINEYVEKNLKKGRYEITYEGLLKEKQFLTTLQTKLQTNNVQFLQDQFSNYDEILQLSYQCCWMQILTKSTFFPTFDKTKVLFFRIDIAPLSINMNDQSINVELQSFNTTDMK